MPSQYSLTGLVTATAQAVDAHGCNAEDFLAFDPGIDMGEQRMQHSTPAIRVHVIQLTY